MHTRTLPEPQPLGLRDRTRRAMRREIADAAGALFLERGYKATTVEDIAVAAGISQRSVYRYFPTKEDIILGKFDFAAQDMIATLRASPAGDSEWVALRSIFDVLVHEADEPRKRALAATVLRVVLDTPALFARYLQRLQEIQDAAAAVLSERAQAAGLSTDDPALRARVAAAFGCLVAAQRCWLSDWTKRTLSDTLDRAMASVRPADGPWSAMSTSLGDSFLQDTSPARPPASSSRGSHHG